MTSQSVDPDHPATPEQPAPQRPAPDHAYVALRSVGLPNSIAHEFDFWDDSYEARRLFSELLGTFFLVLVAVGGGMVNARFGGHTVPYTALVVAPALMVAAIILFMGAVSGAHLNPAVSIAFALRGDFPWKRVPAYVVAQFLGQAVAHARVGDECSARDTRRDVPAGLRFDERVILAAEHQGRDLDAGYRGDLLGPAGRELPWRGRGISRAPVMADLCH